MEIKRFWRLLSTDMGKPRNGVVFSCYKERIRAFRRLSRQCVNNTQLLKFQDMNRYFVPVVLHTGIIILLLKKQTLNLISIPFQEKSPVKNRGFTIQINKQTIMPCSVKRFFSVSKLQTWIGVSCPLKY